MSDTAAAVAGYLQTRQPEEAVRASLSLASGSNPDAEAEFARLSREAGIPIDSVRDNKDAVKQRLAMPDPVELATKFPHTTKYLSKLDNARVAHDDVGTLTAIEQAVRGFMDPARTRTSPRLPKVVNSAQFSAEVAELMARSPGLDADTARTVLMGAMTVDDQSPLIGQSRGPKPTIGNIFRGAFNLDQFRQADAGASVIASDILGFDSANAVRAYQRAKARVDVNTPEFETATGRGLYGGLTSTVRNAPGIALSIASGSAIPGLVAAGFGTGVDAYGKYRARGATPGEAGVGAVAEGAIEVGTELLPMSFLVKKLGKAGAGDFIKGLLAREVPGEQLATIAQDAVDTAIANPDKTWGEYFRERPGAAYQTLLATLVQTGVMGAANKVVGKVAGFDATVERAEMTAAAAEKLVGLADASKLRQRDPQAFQQFIAEVAGDGDAPSEFYIDAEQLANSLNQSAITIEQLRAFAPAVAQQLEASRFVPGADIRVPVAEFAAADPKIAATLIEHLREAPDAMSRAEAQAFIKDQGKRIEQEVGTALADNVAQTARKQAVEAVRQVFEGQLNATGKFRPEVNRAYATMLGNFYATQAERAGVTVEEFMDRYQLRITKKDGGGQQRLEQAAAQTQDTVNAFAQEVKARHGLAKLHVSLTEPGEIELSSITVDPKEFGQGKGTAAMKDIIAYADANGLRIVLDPADRGDEMGTTSRARLVKFYKRFGFVENRGRKVDHEIFSSMYRLPKGGAQLSRGNGGTLTADQMRTELRARFGDVVDTLEERGVLKLWDGFDAFNEAGGQLSEDYRGAQGMFLQGTAHIFGDGVMPGNAIPVFLHEVGEHASMKAMLGERYKVLVKRAYALAKQGDPIAVQALMRIPDNTPKKFMDSEMVAYLIEEAAGQENASEGVKAWLLDVIAAVKAFLFEKGIDIDLTPQEIAALAVRAVKFQARQEGRTAGAGGEAALSMPNTVEQPAFHGSPHQFDKFSLDKMGTGEGAQAFGWGLYFTENKAIAEHYRKTLSDSSPNSAVFLNGERVANNTPEHHAASLLFFNDNREIKATAKRWLKEMAGNEGMADTARKAGLSSEEYWTRLNAFVQAHNRKQIDIAKGQTYEVEVPDDEVLLLWDKPMSAQPAFVKQKLAEAGVLKEFKDNMSDFASPMDTRGKGKGENLYAYLAWKHGGPRQASEFLNSIGIPGHKFKQNTLTGNPGKGYNFVIWNEDAITMLRTLYQGEGGPRGSLSFGNDITSVPSIIALMEGADLSTFLHESGHLFLEVQADLAARIQRKAIGGMNDTSESEQQIVKDMNAILEWMGVNPADTGSRLDAWLLMSLEEKREHHESWARGFERYLMEGRAPSQELQGLFSKFRSWLISVYKALAGLNVDLTDEVRQVMDRMLATDEAIAEAQDARNMGPLFESPEVASQVGGMTPAAYAKYQNLGARQTAEASAQVDAKLLKDMRWLSRAKDKALKARQAEVDELRREVEAEVRSAVLSSEVYQAWVFLTGKRPRGMEKSAAEVQYEQDAEAWKTKRAEAQAEVAKDIRAAMLAERPDLKKLERGQFLAKNKRQIDLQVQQSMLEWEQSYPKPQRPATSEEAVPPEFEVGRLNTDAVKAVDKGAASKLMERRMTSPEGMDPEIVAARFGFSSADHMVKALAAAPPPSQVIEEMVDQQMLERYGDVTSQEALDRAADESVHNEVRARVVATELKALEKATTVRGGPRNTVDVMARAAKEYAYAAIAAIRVRDLRPSQYSAAAARSAKLAQQALGKSTEEAAMHKRNELINGYAAKAAYDAQEEVRALQKYMRKFDKRIDSIDPGYQDQIEQLLERFDFKPASLKAIDKRKSFAAWYAEQEATGNAPSVPDELLDEASRKSYKDMTVEELRGLRDTVKQIEHQGRLKKKLLLARDKRDFDAIATDMAASIIEHGGKARPVQLEGPNPVMDWFAGAWASHRKLASLFRQMDGNKDAGPMWEYIGRSMNEQSTAEDVALEQATVKLRELYAPLLKLRGGITGYRSKVFIPEINASLTRGGRLSVALNWGNEANRQRIMDGDKWTVDQVQAILKTLSPVELDFVNKVWEFLDSYWPQIAAKEKRLTGVEPEKVEATPFNVIASDGTEVAMTGGYLPLKYDTDRSDRADQQEAAQAAKEMMQGVFSKATTRRGHTKERLKEVKRAVRKDLNVITQHVTQVVHDLAFHEWLIDTNKLLADERIVSAIRDHYGPKVLKTMRDDVLGIATADVVPQTDVDKMLLMLRGNVTRATMGASLTTAFLQPFGLTQSIVRIGGRHVLRGLARWGGDAARMENAVSWIHERSEFMRLRAKTFNRELREIRGSVQGKSATMRVVDAGLFVMMQKMQMVADVPTWLGQYEKSMSEGASEADAIAMADRAVLESQGGGNTKDMAEVQRKHPMLTQFYSYFSVTLNLAAEQTAATDFKNPAAVAGWLGDMALLMVIPAILPPFILYSLRGGDDDDEKGMARRIVEWQVSYLLGTVVGLRELSGAVAGYDYAGPPVGRVIKDIGKAGQQTAQGEVDEPAVLAYINLMGTVFGIPVVQALRSYKGWKAWDEGVEGAGPQSVLLGPPPKD